MEKYHELLLKNPLFSDIDPGDITLLLQCLNGKTQSYRKNDIIFLAGDKARAVGIVRAGSVNVMKEDFMGNRTILAIIGKGGMFGEAFACAQTDKLPVSVIARADSEILLIDYKKIITTCPSACAFHHRMIENMLGILAEKNVALNKKMDIMSRRSTREKLIAYLSDRAAEAGSGAFDIPFSRQELADYLCVDRSAMSTALSKLQSDGVLRYTHNSFELLLRSDDD
ncbi:MAG: Crp/Fnr family transcriptional regulator [Oscillospiraceae bacterium]|jgi:CRP-like cAMP-binding protein|nr:Crp/Fnr family transcriptional regulator [Oscillospiraceae bacterium]